MLAWRDCFKCNWLQWRVLNPKFQKTSYFFDILFSRCTTWHLKQVSFPMYDLFVCIIQILFEYCSTDIVPEVHFVTPISVGVVAVTFVISRYDVVTVINPVLKLMLFSLFLFLQKLRCCSNLLLVLNLRWHMLQLTYCPLFWFWFCWFEVINSLWLSSMTTSCLNKIFLLQFLINIQCLDE